MMGLLSRPRIIAGFVGAAALAALVWSWHSRGQEIETLEVRLAHCADQRRSLEQAAENLKGRIEAQNAAIADLEDAADRMSERAAAAEKKAARARTRAEKEIAAIMARRPAGETEIERCREARALLVR